MSNIAQNGDMESYGFIDLGCAEDIKVTARYDAATDTWDIQDWIDGFGNEIIEKEILDVLDKKAKEPEVWKNLVEQFDDYATFCTYIRGEDY